jgi:hypothetical protein
MTTEEKQALETVALFAIQHIPCGLVEQSYHRGENEMVTVHASCRSCRAATSATVTISALAEQLRMSLQSS